MKKSSKIIQALVIGTLLVILVTAIGFRIFGPDANFGDFSLLSSEKIRGNGNLVNKSFPTKDFNSIDVRGKFDLVIQPGQSGSISVKTDENIFPQLSIKTINKTLTLETLTDVSVRPAILISNENIKNIMLTGKSTVKALSLNNRKVLVTMNGKSSCNLKGNIKTFNANLNGKSILQAELPEADTVNIITNGKGYVYLTGKTKHLIISAQGSSTIDTKKLVAEQVTLNSTGRSSITVYATKTLAIMAAGSSDIKYVGNATVTQDSVGGSSIEKIND